MSIEGLSQGRGDGCGTGIGALYGAFQRSWKIRGRPGSSQEKIGDGCLRKRSMSSGPSVAGEKWINWPIDLRFARFWSLSRRKVEQRL